MGLFGQTDSPGALPSDGSHVQGRIVLADDSLDMLREIRALLTRDFEIVDAVRSGEALIAAARVHKPELVISDLQMPGINGIEACRSIIQDHLCPAAIILTIHNDAQLVSRALRAGIQGYVLKIQAGDELIPAIKSVLRGSLYLSRGVRTE